METQEKLLQVLPHSVSKKQLMAMYLASGLNERRIRLDINTIIAANPVRKLPPDKPVQVQQVWHAELMEFVELHGLPKGYRLREKI